MSTSACISKTGKMVSKILSDIFIMTSNIRTWKGQSAHNVQHFILGGMWIRRIMN